MGEYDFSYTVPENFKSRVVQYLKQSRIPILADIFMRCKYEYEDMGNAFYAGMRGDNWNKNALDFTIECSQPDLDKLRTNSSVMKEAIGRALKSNDTGYLIRELLFIVDDELTLTLPETNGQRLAADISAAEQVLADILWVGEQVCKNANYNEASSEDTINDYFRDMLLARGYAEIKDQTRHGLSASGKSAGEVDLLLSKESKEIALVEALKLSGIRSNYIDDHIQKAIVNYNALGTATFIVAYVCGVALTDFWQKYINHLKAYDFGLEVRNHLTEYSYPNASERVAQIILSRDGYDFPVYFLAIRII